MYDYPIPNEINWPHNEKWAKNLKESTCYMIYYCMEYLDASWEENNNRLELFFETKNRYGWLLKHVIKNDRCKTGTPTKEIFFKQIPTKCLPLLFICLLCFCLDIREFPDNKATTLWESVFYLKDLPKE